MVPCRVLGWCGWATIDGLRFVDPDAELRERLSRRTVKSLSMVAGSRFRGNDGRVITGGGMRPDRQNEMIYLMFFLLQIIGNNGGYCQKFVFLQSKKQLRKE